MACLLRGVAYSQAPEHSRRFLRMLSPLSFVEGKACCFPDRAPPLIVCLFSLDFLLPDPKGPLPERPAFVGKPSSVPFTDITVVLISVELPSLLPFPPKPLCRLHGLFRSVFLLAPSKTSAPLHETFVGYPPLLPVPPFVLHRFSLSSPSFFCVRLKRAPSLLHLSIPCVRLIARKVTHLGIGERV